MFDTTNRSTNSRNSASKKVKKLYRKVACDSYVDEDLFASTHKNSRNNKNASETIQLVSKDLIRNIRIKRKDPMNHSTVVSLDKLKESAFLCKKMDADIKNVQKDTRKVENESNDRKTHFKQIDFNKKKMGGENTQLQVLADLEKKEILDKATEKMEEREDEIKELNSLIVSAKCNFIRDKQIKEKLVIQNHLKKEDKRLDQIMEANRKLSLNIQEEIDKDRKKQSVDGALELLKQIQQNQKRNLLEIEKKEQENMKLQNKLDKLCQEEIEKLTIKQKNQQSLREQLNKANEKIIMRKAKDLEQDKLLEKNVLKYQEEKAKREAEYEEEQEKIKINKEKEVARLRALQERLKDEHAERDLLRAKRAQDLAERKWRESEIENARKIVETENMLQEAREKQLNAKRHIQAVEAKRERASFEKIINVQKTLIEKDKLMADERRKKSDQYSRRLRNQINEKYNDKMAERTNFFKEGNVIHKENAQREEKLKAIKVKKLQELRDAHIDEKYLTEIVRKIKIDTEN